ncbi:MAG: UDP-3-O-(3-hydroxymyristoyl)glucosamine N-acyltransferase [Bacteroidota bacterium]|nr:UDP-3-O-(3-hydroxymyristoyl)glucosamine N-acyltransferase [Bacteroidota bacterium]
MYLSKEKINKLSEVEINLPGSKYYLALSNSQQPDTLSFCDTEKFLREIEKNENITALFVTEAVAQKITNTAIALIKTEDPRYDFYYLLNEAGKENYKEFKSEIHSSAKIHDRAYVALNNVKIGANTIIEPNVTILADVEIGENCIIRAGSVIGSEGFEQKRTQKGILAVLHFGKVIISDNVHLGALNSVAKGMSFRDTTIGDSTRTDNLVHIAHGVQIGKRCFLPASSMIAGSVTVEDDVWIGPNASISSGVVLKTKSFITIGAVVTRTVEEAQTVSGNFAIPHQKFLRNLKNSLND